ncbi:uncharacterized protein [Dermacentor andersoni]|uniref:uncharacterized protein n=1 Tax=Dermacentor andersoni TaxID=34620 RepID=UPI0024173CF5|nr:uncharacterized protein LOC129380293 [Dermacentor andersoni]
MSTEETTTSTFVDEQDYDGDGLSELSSLLQTRFVHETTEDFEARSLIDEDVINKKTLERIMKMVKDKLTFGYDKDAWWKPVWVYFSTAYLLALLLGTITLLAVYVLVIRRTYPSIFTVMVSAEESADPPTTAVSHAKHWTNASGQQPATVAPLWRRLLTARKSDEREHAHMEPKANSATTTYIPLIEW